MEFCKTCHEPLQLEVKWIDGSTRTVGRMCKCQRDEHKADQARIREREIDIEREIRRRKCFFGKRYLDHTFENFKGNNGLTAGKRFVDEFGTMQAEKRGLLIKGPVGTGKTYLAACIANALLDKGYSVRFTTFGQIEKILWSEHDRAGVLTDLTEADLLVIDDFGVERKTDYMNEIVTEVIDMRFASGKPLIVTTNLTDFVKADTIEQERVYSRINGMCHPLTLDGEDRRIESAINSYAMIEEVLHGE